MQVIDHHLVYYINQIKNIPVLSRGEECVLCKRIEQGDQAARKQLVLSNLRFVIRFAKRYANKNIPFMDLVHEGNLGLLRATETFDASKGNRFISYASHWIKQAIVKAIADKGHLVRLPLNANNQLVALRRELSQGGTPDPSQGNLSVAAKRMGARSCDLVHLMQTSARYVPLERHVGASVGGEDGQGRSIQRRLKDERFLGPEEQVCEWDMLRNLKKALSKLNPLEREVLQRRFGLGDSLKETLHNIGRRKGLTRERIRQIEQSALKNLRKSELLIEDLRSTKGALPQSA